MPIIPLPPLPEIAARPPVIQMEDKGRSDDIAPPIPFKSKAKPSLDMPKTFKHLRPVPPTDSTKAPPPPAADPFTKFMDESRLDSPTGLYSEGSVSLEVGGTTSGNDPNKIPYHQVAIFEPARDQGSLGLIAHGSGVGTAFNKLEIGDPLDIVNGSGNAESYAVQEILRFQALDPTSPYSDFIDLETGEQYTAQELFDRVYNSNNPVVLQTCIVKDGDANWGRLFVIGR